MASMDGATSGLAGTDSPNRLSRASLSDFRVLFSLSAGFLLTGIVPFQFDRNALGIALGYLRLPGNPWVRRIEEWMCQILGAFLPRESFRQHAIGFCSGFRESEWIRARAMHRRIPPIEIDLEGVDHLQRAMRDGRGAVLWSMASCGRLVAHIALLREGVKVILLSGAGHGAPDPTTSLGLRIVAPLYCRPENRFLEERVVIPLSGSLGYMRTLMDRLSNNGCVYIEGERFEVNPVLWTPWARVYCVLNPPG